MNLSPAITRALSAYCPFVSPPPARYKTEDGEPVYAMAAEFADVPTLYHAAETVRDAGYKNWDVYAAFPIHGIDEAMGHKRTNLPMMVAGGAFTGVLFAWCLQFWISALDYPLMKQGKPFGSWEPFLPIMFELGVLAAAFTSLLGMLALNGLPRWHHPLLAKRSFLRVSDDKLMIVVECHDPKFDPTETADLLKGAGATSVELVEDA